MLKIIAGSAKGRTIKTPPGNVRPATARVRRALFDYLSNVVPDSRVLDLYCGSGGLGLEALSRGAESACFVDLSERSIKVVRDNTRSLGWWDQASFYKSDVFRFLRKYGTEENERFDLILAAPPYKIAEPGRLLLTISDSGVLESQGIVAMEYPRHSPPPNPSSFTLARRKVYGETVVDVWDYTG